MIQIKPATKQAWNLFHEANLVFCDIEQNGLCIDVEYCQRAIQTLGKRLKVLREKLEEQEITKKWKAKYGKKFNLDSNQQLADILFKDMGIEPPKTTEKGTHQTDADALERIDGLEIAEDIIRYRRLSMCKRTFLKNILAEQVDGIMHPFFHLHNIISYRDSSSNINFKNQPRRNEEQMRIVRKAFIPRKDHMIGEIDFSGAEVRMSCNYHKDENMIKDVLDPNRDMHRDMAMECYKLGTDEWTKAIRHEVKSGFVFSDFYDAYYITKAAYLWDAIKLRKLQTPKGLDLYEHLKSKGIKSYNQFENHIKKVEDRFNTIRYPQYSQWKENYYSRYKKRGYFVMKTGFCCSGYMPRRMVINYPIQGASFHCLLWVMIQLHKCLMKNEMDTRIGGEIYDSIFLDIHPDEYQKVLDKSIELIDSLQDHWKWMIIPMTAEIEVCPINEPWNNKREVQKDGKCPNCQVEYLYWGIDDTQGEYWECPLCGENSLY